MIRFARLLKDLPDVKAGAIFYTPSKDHWCYITEREPFYYNVYQYYYFPYDTVENKNVGIPEKGDHTYYNTTQMSDEWFEFYDFSDGKWKPYEKVKMIELS